MLDQTFSAKNFLNVYAQENRMGRIPVETMGMRFQYVMGRIKEANAELKELRKRKKTEKTDEDQERIDELKKKLKDLKEVKQ